VLQREEIQVVASEPIEWKKNLTLFEKILLGDGEIADQCRLINPYVIDLRRSDNTLVGASDSLLRVENPALGYSMDVVMSRFEWDITKEQGLWTAYVHFHESVPESEDQHKEWMDHRWSVYEGSLRHFFWALVHKRLRKEGFQMRTGRDVSASRLWSVIREDSIHLTEEPGTRFLEWIYPEWIRVDLDFPSPHPSFLHLVEARALFDSSGVLVTPLAFNIGGRWASERLGRMLPADYFPIPRP
jgi:hypothetical protein